MKKQVTGIEKKGYKLVEIIRNNFFLTWKLKAERNPTSWRTQVSIPRNFNNQ